MKYVLLLCSVLLGHTALFGQCAISVQLWNDTGCGPNDSFYLTTTGGTAPFNILVERHHLISGQWMVVESVTADADGDLGGTFGLNSVDQLRATVTDALGCVATQTNAFQAYAVVGSYVMYGNDPCTGMNDVYFQIVGTNCSPGYLTATHTLIIDGTPLGLIGETCTYDGIDFRITQQLPNGTHEITFSGPSCISGVLWCWVPVSFTLSNPYSGDCGVNLSLRAALDGALPSGTVMSDALRAASLVPPAQPYTALGYIFVGSPTAVSVSPALLAVTGNNAIVDWVVAELRNPAAPYAVVYSKPALIQRDGDVVDADGNPYVNFPVTPGNYRVALRHRNHLGVMTGSAWSLVLNPDYYPIDLRLGSTTTYGTNARVQKNGVWCLWAGDANGNGTIAYTGANNDRDLILQAIGGTVPTNTLSNVYDRRDLNLDGTVKYTGLGNDRDIILVNIGGTVPTNTRVQQLP